MGFRSPSSSPGSPASLAAKFAAVADIRVTLSGPRISPVTVAAAWQPKSGTFGTKLPIPAKVKTGQNYLITVRENVGTAWLTAPHCDACFRVPAGGGLTHSWGLP
jgi:hypothetical protein